MCYAPGVDTRRRMREHSSDKLRFDAAQKQAVDLDELFEKEPVIKRSVNAGNGWTQFELLFKARGFLAVLCPSSKHTGQI
jgi:hypothetical protein